MPMLQATYNPADLSMVALRLAAQAGLQSHLHLRAALPSVEELEAEFGSDLLQQAGHMVRIHNANHGPAVAALNEAVGVVGALDVGCHLQLKPRVAAFTTS